MVEYINVNSDGSFTYVIAFQSETQPIYGECHGFIVFTNSPIPKLEW